MRIINEPTAAGLAYGFEKQEAGKRNYLIYDLGGGTFDVSILSVNNGYFKIKGKGGDLHLGGNDFDLEIMEHAI